MLFLTVTSETWLVTGLGFGLVLVLLCVFVYLMKLLGWIMQPRVKAGKQDDMHHDTVAHTQKEGKDAITMTANTTAAIAMALHLYYNSVHDEEPTHITVRNHATQWNSKAFGMNQ